jgi:hypothetical protein
VRAKKMLWAKLTRLATRLKKGDKNKGCRAEFPCVAATSNKWERKQGPFLHTDTQTQRHTNTQTTTTPPPLVPSTACTEIQCKMGVYYADKKTIGK